MNSTKKRNQIPKNRRKPDHGGQACWNGNWKTDTEDRDDQGSRDQEETL